MNHLSICKFLVLTLELQFLEIEARNGIEKLLHSLRTLLQVASCRMKCDLNVTVGSDRGSSRHRPDRLRSSRGNILILLSPLGLLFQCMNSSVGFLRSEVVTVLLQTEIILINLGVRNLFRIFVSRAPDQRLRYFRSLDWCRSRSNLLLNNDL